MTTTIRAAIARVPMLMTLLALGAFVAGAAQAARRPVDDQMLGDVADGRNWATYGRTFDESHYSPLTGIDAGNVGRLNLVWSLDLDVNNPHSTPLAADGVIYLAAGYSIVHAVDAKSGRLLWRYDSEVAKYAGVKLRTGWGIRGLALWKDRVLVGTHDGRLLALDAKRGRLLWTAQVLDPKDGTFISGPPRVFKGKVIIGFGGADFMPVRAYVDAYDVATGKRLWRFYTVPGDPARGFEDEAQAMAAKTWSGEWWKLGGGGTVWNAMTYDPEYNRVYLGTGNGGPWNQRLRSPGGGDNLFLCSIVALDADTGQYVWHYQTVPGDVWDYNSSMDMTLATLNLGGKPRKVILHAPKNGFFYVIDRDDGKLISAEKIGKVTWAERIDLATGRPVEAPDARYPDGPVTLWPSFQGVHNHSAQSWNPKTGLTYVPTIELPITFNAVGVDPDNWRPIPYSAEFAGMASGGDGDPPADAGTSRLIAWNPVTQREAWSQPTPGAFNGGTMTTAGGLVFHGTADGYLHAFDATRGAELWKFYAGGAVMGSPITFMADGRQYVSVTAGPMNGSFAGFGSLSAQFGWNMRTTPKRLLTFALDGKAALPPTPPPARVVPLDPPDWRLDDALVQRGLRQYVRCMLCHGTGAVAGGTAPDLRASPVVLDFAAFAAIVRDGGLESRNMPRFVELTDEELRALQHYIRHRARQ
jgi:quinohemoprotein ethanol dehydrogenase